MTMASQELFLSESEWQNLLSVKDSAKELFDVDIRRKDEFYESEAVTVVGGVGGSASTSTKVVLPPQFSHEIFSDVNPSTASGNDDVHQYERSNSKAIHDYVIRPPPIIVLIETKGSPENLEKCKKFAFACTPSNPDYKIHTVHVENLVSLEMVRASSSHIQQSTSALMTIDPNELNITIQGYHTCVESARDAVNLILQDLEIKAFENGSIHYMDNKKVNTNSALAHQGGKNTLWPCNYNGSTPKTTKNNIFLPESDYNCSHEALPFQNYKESSPNKICVNNNISSDSEEDNILTDERFKKRIDQATKCGFSDQQVMNVLRKLGVKCNMDEMMRELIKQPVEVDADPDMMGMNGAAESLTLSSKGDDSDDGDGFDVNDSSNLRHIIIDGSNVAMSHGQKVFSCKGIKIVVDWFKNRGHKNITVFVPQWRKEASRPDAPIADQEILSDLEQEKIVVFTPARRVGGTRIVCYDDRFILQLAAQKDGIVVSNDVYRDLVRERDDFRKVVETRLLQYSFAQDTFMPPEDPLGRQGPLLDNFLRIKPSEPKNRPQNCPYGKKCTYGNKCRFYHPERRYGPQKMVAEKLKENAELKLKSGKAGKPTDALSGEKVKQPKQKLARTISLLQQEVSNCTNSDSKIEDAVKKPPLKHSRSLVYPESYLTEMRVKMEQAESSDIAQTDGILSHDIRDLNLWQKAVNDSAGESDSNRRLSHSCTTSPRTSPVPAIEVLKSKVTAVKSYPSSPMPHLPQPVLETQMNITKPESSGRYLSGHVLVAKRLSDEENTSGKFLSQHTSRSPGLSQQQASSLEYEGALLSLESNTLIDGNEESNQCSSNEICFPPDVLIPKGYEMVSDEYNVMMNSPISPSFPSVINSSGPSSLSYKSCPAALTQNEETFQTRKQPIQRSISTTSPCCLPQHNPSPHCYHRKGSLNTVLKSTVTYHSPYRQQYNIPSHYQPLTKPQFQRNRSTHDSGISSGLSASLFSPTEDSNFFSGQTASLPSQPPVFSPPPNPSFLMMQQQGMMTKHPCVQNPMALQRGGNSTHPVTSFSPHSPLQYSPLPATNRMPFEAPLQEQSHMMVQNSQASSMIPSMHRSMYNPQYLTGQYPPHTPLHPIYQQNVERPYYQSPVLPTNGGDQFTNNPSMPAFSYSQQHQPRPVKPVSKVIDEEAPFSVDDPRYSLYFNMSSVFGERVVRVFMNRNPDVRSPKQLHDLISSYKQEH